MMERPNAPRRKSSAGEAEDGLSKTKAHRKSFVVGTKSHHRVPSYGKKLNQLSKLTALTTSDSKPQDNSTTGSPRRGSMNRSMSQKNLLETRTSRRNGSTQDLRKLRRSSSHHGSSAKLSAIRPLSKTENSQAQDLDPGVRIEDGSTITEPPKSTKRPTFVIEDEEGDEGEEEREEGEGADQAVEEEGEEEKQEAQKEEEEEKIDALASSFADRPQGEDAHIPVSRKQDNLVPVSQSLLSPKSTQLSATREASQKVSDVTNGSTISQDAYNPSHIQETVTAVVKTDARQQLGPSSGLLFRAAGSPVVPQLSKESAISKDIQIKERPASGRSISMLNVASTPVNSQPLTSRFLESPRGNATSLSMSHQHSNLSKENDIVAPSAMSKPTINPIYQSSPHGSSTNLGGGSSRTQQKLMLQRASSIYFDGISDGSSDAKTNSSIRPKAHKEIDRISREYKNVKRFRDPFKELAYRLYAKGIAMPSAQPLRRTMTQMALANGNGDVKTPKTSQSSSNLRRPQISSKATTGDVEKLLQDLWLKDDHIDNPEE